jgi:hypothetical protein
MSNAIVMMGVIPSPIPDDEVLFEGQFMWGVPLAPIPDEPVLFQGRWLNLNLTPAMEKQQSLRSYTSRQTEWMQSVNPVDEPRYLIFQKWCEPDEEEEIVRMLIPPGTRWMTVKALDVMQPMWVINNAGRPAFIHRHDPTETMVVHRPYTRDCDMPYRQEDSFRVDVCFKGNVTCVAVLCDLLQALDWEDEQCQHSMIFSNKYKWQKKYALEHYEQSVGAFHHEVPRSRFM